MWFRRIAAICVVLAAMAAPGHADSFSDYKAFQHVADSCGKTTNRSYSKAQYAEGKEAADREIKRLGELQKKDSSYAGRIEEVKAAKKKLKDCEKEEAAKFPLPPFKDCKAFLTNAKSFMFWAAKARAEKSATEADIERSRQRFKARADHCVRETLKNCIDPLDTKAVLEAIDTIETASKFTDVFSYAKQTGLERFLTRTNPYFLTLKFCADTDFACTGDPTICKSRRAALRAALQAYVER